MSEASRPHASQEPPALARLVAVLAQRAARGHQRELVTPRVGLVADLARALGRWRMHHRRILHAGVAPGVGAAFAKCDRPGRTFCGSRDLNHPDR